MKLSGKPKTMDIHEYEAKAILKDYGVPVPAGAVARSAEAAEAVAAGLGGASYAVKAQVLAGGRGGAGGVRLVETPAAAGAAAGALLGQRLVTEQTGSAGLVVSQVYVEAGYAHERELYLAILVERSVGRVAFLACAEGGGAIDDRAAPAPDAVLRLVVDPDEGVEPGKARALAGQLGLRDEAADGLARLMAGLYRAFLEKDASLIEINPLVTTKEGALLALDVKMSFDDNALFRHPEIAALRDLGAVDAIELEAARHELNYVRLDGDIGVMVNGAGLALATIDLLKQNGGEPADFMDMRPVATRQQVAAGFKMLLGNPKVKAILVNIYGGGILRCDTIAEAIGMAVREVGLGVPLVVRAAGTNGEIARKSLTSQGVAASFADTMEEAVTQAVRAASKGAV